MMIYLLGDSHIGCLKRAAEMRPQLQGIKMASLAAGSQLVRDFYVAHDDHIEFTLGICRTVMKHVTGSESIPAGEGHLYGFSLGLFPFRVCQIFTWRNFVPAALGLKSPKWPLSRAAIEALVRQDIEGQQAFFRSMKRLGIPFFVIESPPLFDKLPILQIEHGRTIIQHVADIYRQIASGGLQEIGVDIVAHPPEARQADGFLKHEFEIGLPKDIRHANADYGVLMLDRILEYLASRTDTVPSLAGAA